MTDEEIVKRAKDAEKRTSFGELVHSPISKGVNSAYGIGFIDGMEEYRSSLQREPVIKNLEKASRRYAALQAGMKDAMTSEYYEEYPYSPNDIEAFKAGAQWQKQQMMKTAKSGIGNNDNYIQFEDGTWIDLDPSMQLKSAFNVKEGEKVKVLVIKED